MSAEKKAAITADGERSGAFSREETLRFLLSAGGREKDIAAADDLLAEYGKLADAFRDYRMELLSDETRGLVAVARDLSTSRLKRRVPGRRTRFDTPDKVGAFFMDWFHGLDTEEMAALYLDEDKRAIDCITTARGDQYSVRIDVRGITAKAEALSAKFVIIAHNHPHTPLLPSRADLDGTVVVAWSARMTGVELLDHIVVYENDFVSLYESGLLSDERRLSGATFTVSNGELIGILGRNKGRVTGSNPQPV